MAKYLLAAFLLSVVVVSGQVIAPTPANLDPATAAARTALARQYERIDAAQSAGRMEEILAIALPGAQGGSSMMRLTLAQHLLELKSVQASGTTEIVAVNLVGGEAQVRTRAEVRITVSGRIRTMQGATQDVWVERDREWRLKEITVTSMREVLETLAPDAVKRVGRAISAVAVPLATTVAGGPRQDLIAFGKAVGNARIVSLGEASHGTREIFQMKHRLLEYLVREKGFTVFAMEANWPESHAADRYIKTGEGDPRQALKDMYFWTWQTGEVLAMLEWMREYNKARGDRPILSFTAFDMQTWDVAAARVTAFVRQHARPEEAATVEAAYKALAALPKRTLRDPAFQAAAEQAEIVTALLESRREALAKAAGAAAFRDALQMSRIVAQASRNRTPAATAGYRDEMMAKNVEWLAKEAHPGEKIVLWAHNGHVSTNGGGASGWRPMGSWLRQTFGPQMYVLGFAIHTGSVRAVGAGSQSSGVAVYAMPTAPLGSGTSVLSAAGKPVFFLDIATALTVREGSALADWLKSNQSFREVGAMWHLEESAENNVRVAALADCYDGLIYFEKSEAAKGLN
jgi:erythromycin esterase